MTADQADAARDAVALARAFHEDDGEAARIILDAADTRALAVELARAIIGLARAMYPAAGDVGELLDEWQQQYRRHAAGDDGGQRP